MNADGKYSTRLANQIHLIKRIMHHDEVGFIPVMQCWFNIKTSVNIIHDKKNNMIISGDAEKAF